MNKQMCMLVAPGLQTGVKISDVDKGKTFMYHTWRANHI